MEIMSEKTFLEAVNAAYKAKGLKQSELAVLVGVTATSLNAILRGRTKLTEAMARRLADATGADFRLYWGGDAPGQVGEFVPIPLREASGSMGPGSFENSRKIKTYLAFREDWVHGKGNPSTMSGIRAHGTSMSPTIPNGCIVLIDEGQRELLNGRVYYVRTQDGFFLKRVRKLGDAWYLESDEDGARVNIAELDEFEPLGRALWFGCEL